MMTTTILFVRHGPTLWNAARRIQGHTDVPLSAVGREQVSLQSVPPEYQDANWTSSPLKRAVQTAQIMGCENPGIEPLLSEMHWGEWEGLTLQELRQRLGSEMKANENRGLDFQPGGGETPRQVGQRVQKWLNAIDEPEKRQVVISHKGVIRATLSLATGWDMKGPPPVRLNWSCGQEFTYSESEGLKLIQANVPLKLD